MNTREWLFLEQMARRRPIRLDMAGEMERSRFQHPQDPPLSGDAGWFDDEIKDRKSRRSRGMPSRVPGRNTLIGVGAGAATLGLMGLAAYTDYRQGKKDLDLYERHSKAQYPERSDMVNPIYGSSYGSALIGVNVGLALGMGIMAYTGNKLNKEGDRITEEEIVRIEANNRADMATGEYSDVTPEEFAAMNDEQIRLLDAWKESPEYDSYQGLQNEYDENLLRWGDAKRGSVFNPMNLVNRNRRPDSHELSQRGQALQGEFLGLDPSEMNQHRNLSMLSAEGRLGHRDPELVRQALESYDRSPELIDYHLRYLDEVINDDRPAIWKYQEGAFPRGLDLTKTVTGDYRTDMDTSEYAGMSPEEFMATKDEYLSTSDPWERVGYWEREIENIVQRRNPDMEHLSLAEAALLEAEDYLLETEDYMDYLDSQNLERTDMEGNDQARMRQVISDLFDEDPSSFPMHSEEELEYVEQQLALQRKGQLAQRGNQIRAIGKVTYPYQTPTGELRWLVNSPERTDMQPASNTSEVLGLAGGNPMEDIQNRERKHLRADMDGDQEFAGISEAVAAGLLAMAADAEEAGELSEEDIVEVSNLVDLVLEVSMSVESGEDPGEAGEVVSGFLESNMEIADMAGELGAALLSAEGR